MTLEKYLAYAITQVNRNDADEILLISRRLQYLTSKYSDDYTSNDILPNLTDVDTNKKMLDALTHIYKT